MIYNIITIGIDEPADSPPDLMLVPGHVDGITYNTELHEFEKEEG